MNRADFPAFPPGDYIKEELAERGWTQADLAQIMGRNASALNQIITGKGGITAATAKELSEAFGTTAELWMNLESSYRLSLAAGPGGEIRRRAELFKKAPLEAMEKRGRRPIRSPGR